MQKTRFFNHGPQYELPSNQLGKQNVKSTLSFYDHQQLFAKSMLNLIK
jgi:hypothetical protein